MAPVLGELVTNPIVQLGSLAYRGLATSPSFRNRSGLEC
jgi:hypothetical protein